MLAFEVEISPDDKILSFGQAFLIPGDEPRKTRRVRQITYTIEHWPECCGGRPERRFLFEYCPN
jgi:hypothetical protein